MATAKRLWGIRAFVFVVICIFGPSEAFALGNPFTAVDRFEASRHLRDAAAAFGTVIKGDGSRSERERSLESGGWAKVASAANSLSLSRPPPMYKGTEVRAQLETAARALESYSRRRGVTDLARAHVALQKAERLVLHPGQPNTTSEREYADMIMGMAWLSVRTKSVRNKGRKGERVLAPRQREGISSPRSWNRAASIPVFTR